MINTDVTVIGGGAAGLMAAITAARCGAQVIILEHMDRVGKKILSTGNGKCNYTNALQGISYYRGEDPAFVLPVFEQFDFAKTVAFFKELGIYPKVRNGYYYPASEQAASVLDVLRMECDYLDVEIRTSCELNSVKKGKNGYVIDTNIGAFSTQTVVFAPGLLAAPKTGSDGSAFPHIEKIGHHFIDIVPALVQLQGKQSFFKNLAGIRAEVAVQLYIEEPDFHAKKNKNDRNATGAKSVKNDTNYKMVCEENGELQLTEYGISGIPVFQISRFATRALHEHRSVYALIDFMRGLEEQELFSMLQERFLEYSRGKSVSEALIGLFNKKLIDVLLKESGINLHLPAEQLKNPQIHKLCHTIKKFRVDVIGSKGVDAAQVCAGGVDTSEVDANTMESKIAPGIYFAGEVLDIDGTCGGYNLQWAWSSGYVAGMYAAKKGKSNA